MSKFDKTNSTDDFADIATNKKSFLPICVVLLVVIAIGVGGFYYYFSTPKKIITSVINKAYENYEKLMDEGYDINPTKDTFKIDGNLVVDTNFPGFEKIKNDKINYTLGIDYKKHKVEAGANIIENKTSLINVITYIVNNKSYLSLGDDYKNLISMDEDEVDLDEVFSADYLNVDKDDINYLVKAYKDILIDSINEDKLEKSSDKIEVDGKTTNVTKITYKLNNKNLEELSKNITERTLDNDELLTKLAKVTNTDKSVIKDNLKEEKKNLNVPEKTNLTLNIYTKGFNNDFVGLDLKSDDFTMNIVENKDTTNVKINVEGFDITIDIKEYSAEKIDLDFVVKAAGQKIKGSLVVTDKKDNKDTHKGDIKLNINYADYKVNITTDYTLEKNAKVADVDTKKAVTAQKAQKDLEKVYSKIITRLEKSNLYGIIDSFSSNAIEE